MEVTNVLVLYCPVKSMGDAGGCIDMDLTGGNGIYASNGTYEQITWKKGNTPASPLKLYASDGSRASSKCWQKLHRPCAIRSENQTVISAIQES